MVFYENVSFWLIMVALVLFAWAPIRSMVKGIPFFNKKNNLLLVCGLGLLLTSGLLGDFSLASLSGTSAISAMAISDLQVTTAFNSTLAGALSENSNIPDLLDVRLTDANSNETTAVNEVQLGIITITRTGSLEPTSIPVVASYDSYTGETASTQGNSISYTIVEKDTLGNPSIYLQSGSAATTSSPKGSTAVAFADGVATGTLGILINVDEEAHDALSQYSYKDVTISIGGKPYVVRFHRMD